MGSPGELTLCSSSITTASSMFKSISLVNDNMEKMKKHEEYIRGLEEERKKIEAFKRELPYCMQLLNDAIEACKSHLSTNYRVGECVESPKAKPVLEEFIPLKKSSDSSEDRSEESREIKRKKFDNADKPNWMVTAQLWHPDPDSHDRKTEGEQSLEVASKEQCSENQRSPPSNTRLFCDSKNRIGGAFHPFSKERQVIAPVPIRKVEAIMPDLALSSSPNSAHEVESSMEANETTHCVTNTTTTPAAPTNTITLNVAARNRSKETNEICPPSKEKDALATPISGTHTSSTASTTNTSQGPPARKSRRCWSPELHRCFLNALQQLGGPQVATPKQIRELMKVDGLTNDEVKSHLQKYRLHTRRSSPAPQSANSQPQQVLVLGGFWVPNPEYGAVPIQAAVTSPSQSQYCQPAISQDFYCQVNPSSKLQMHSPFYSEQQSTPSHSHNSAEGPLNCNGQSSGGRGGSSGNVGREESVGEDGKSESTSRKPDEFSETSEARNMKRELCLKNRS